MTSRRRSFCPTSACDGDPAGPHHQDDPVALARPRVRTSVLTPEFLAIKERCLELLNVSFTAAEPMHAAA